MLVIGVMSGTSADGIEVALARVEGEESSQFTVESSKFRRRKTQDPPAETASGAPEEGREVRRELVGHVTVAMGKAVRAEVLRVGEGAKITAGELSQLNFRVGEEFAAAVLKACRKFGVKTEQVGLIGSHGQTVFHQGKAVPFLGRKTASTLQIGEPAVIADRTGITTIGDFRVADVAAGGQGAPLVPFADWVLFGGERVGRVLLNLGGIANLTVLPPGEESSKLEESLKLKVESSKFRRRETQEEEEAIDHSTIGRAHPLQTAQRVGHPQELENASQQENPRAQPGMAVPQGRAPAGVVAFDTGPANMVMDGLVARFTKGRKRFDENARMALRGECVTGILRELMRDPYLRERPPKSTGREYYGREFLERVVRLGKKYQARPEDLVRTATVFTALSVVDALNRFVLPRVEIGEVLVSGGGAKNPLVMAQLAAALAPVKVRALAELGVAAEAKEAYAFALLAYETWNGRTGNFPSATGARRAVVLGMICFVWAGEIAGGSWWISVIRYQISGSEEDKAECAEERGEEEEFTAELAEGRRENGEYWAQGRRAFTTENTEGTEKSE
jgi:1,6-anhydro-N-acetylmuramate kinase